MSKVTESVGRDSPDQGVLCMNPGSSSFKWAWFMSLAADKAAVTGSSDRETGDSLSALTKKYPAGLAIIRFVHGGNSFVTPELITVDSLSQLESLSALAPLHNRNSLSLCRQLSLCSPELKQVAVFDSEFFHDLPHTSRLYGLPRKLTMRYGIRRLGFHGFAHDGMLKVWAKLARANQGGRLVTIQLGSGCSMAALKNGLPQDTTMGFTPNEGLLMSTRCGDIDPGLLTWLQRRENWTPDETDRILNEESGWLGVSGESADMTVLLDSVSASAREARDLVVHRIRKTLGAYYALLGGLDGILISGGIGEGALPFCRRILGGLEHLGITLSPGQDAVNQERDPVTKAICFTSAGSTVACWSVTNDEHRSMLDSVLRHENKTSFLNLPQAGQRKPG